MPRKKGKHEVPGAAPDKVRSAAAALLGRDDVKSSDDANVLQATKYATERKWYAANAKKFALPREHTFVPNTPPDLPLVAGLYLVFAPASGGKTLTALGLATWLRAHGTDVSYQYAYEPGSSVGPSELTAPKHEALLATHFSLDKSGKRQPSVLIFDSLSMALRMLTGVAGLSDTLGDQAYPGGLKPADLAGASLHNDYGAQHKMCIIGTVNSEMLPIVRALSGAVMGIYSIGTPGTLSGMDRTDRVSRPIIIPQEYMDIASRAIGYGGFNTRAASKGRI